MKTSIILLLVCVFCGAAVAQQDVQKKFQRQFIEVPDDSAVNLPAGTFHLDGSLWLDGKKNVVIRGAGEDKTFLDFGKQVSGAEGLKITNSSNISVEGLTVQNTKGDGI